MVCENCKQRHANVTVTQVQNGQKLTHHYCEVCASQFHPFHFEVQEEPISLQQFITNWFGAPVQQQFNNKAKPQQQATSCPKCGFTFKKFLKEGKFGCAECYTTFHDQLPTIFEKLHGGTEHVGKAEQLGGEKQKLIHQIEELREKIQQAIEQELFEEAAVIRDQIKQLQTSLEGGGSDES